VLTSYLLQQERVEPPVPGDAAVAGALAGAVGASIYIIGTAVLFLLFPVPLDENLRGVLARTPELPAEARDAILNISSRPGLLFAVFAVAYVPIYIVFSTLGALLGAALFRKNKPTATGD
jgi:hypothetical protein